MPFSLATPVWLVALVFAAIAPWCVRAFGDAIERNVNRRTTALLNRAGVSPGEGARGRRERASRRMDDTTNDTSADTSESAAKNAGAASNQRMDEAASDEDQSNETRA